MAPDQTNISTGAVAALQCMQTSRPESADYRVSVLCLVYWSTELYKLTEELDHLHRAEQVLGWANAAIPRQHALRLLLSSVKQELAQTAYERLRQPKYLSMAREAAIEAQSLTVSNRESIFDNTVFQDFMSNAMYRNTESNLGKIKMQEFQRSGNVSALREAITHLQSTLDSTSRDNWNWHRHAYMLSCALNARYHVESNLEDLKKAIQLIEDALPTISRGSRFWADYTFVHGDLLLTRYERYGLDQDLQEAVRCSSEAADETGPEDLKRAERLHGLAGVLHTRHRRNQNLEDLQQAVQFYEQALSQAQKYEKERMEAGMAPISTILHDLGDILSNRFERTGNMEDINRSIECTKQALEGPKGRDPLYVGQLGNRLAQRYQITKDMNDLNRAILLGQEALQQIVFHYRPSILNGLALNLASRFRATGKVEDCDMALSLLDQAIEITPPAQSQSGVFQNNRALLLIHKGQRHLIASSISEDETKIFDDFEDASESEINERCHAFEEAFYNVNAPAHVRMVSGENAIMMNIFRAFKQITPFLKSDRESRAAAELEAFAPILILCENVIDLLYELCHRSLSRDDQQFKLSRMDSLPAVAVAVALRGNRDPIKAWQLLEAGCAVMTGLSIDLRRDLTRLMKSHPEVATRYSELRKDALQSDVQAGLRSDSTTISVIKNGTSEMLSRRLNNVEALENCELEIRSLPGFESFQLPFSILDAFKAASEGPIVAINVHGLKSAALVIRKESLGFIDLPDLDREEVERNVNLVLSKAKERLTSGSLRTKRRRNQSMLDILRWLWKTTVRPVLEYLGLLDFMPLHDEKPLLWWHSSGPMSLLPLHAAGIYANDSTENGPSYIYSSYIPTIKALDHARARQALSNNGTKPSALIIGMPSTPDGKSKDLNVNAEIRAIRSALGPFIPISIRIQPSRADVISRLESANIVHFACHGVSDPLDPSESKLKLYNKSTGLVEPLYVRDMNHLSYDRAQLAYLSACSTAKNSVLKLDFEAIHIVNAFQILGFPHVIGTLWQADDDAAAVVAGAFYREVFAGQANNCVLSSRKVVSALYKAVEEVRKEDVEDVLTWVPFVHFGA
ncbi:hypothetical protein MMC14_005275 [Varicellaria rhodocarpa]|nr:hypothetical protein [Varicellaria rhodocarpa]